MPEITTTTITCDFCGKNLKEADETLKGVEAGRYIRVSEAQRPMRYITTSSNDREMRRAVYCSSACLEAQISQGHPK